MVGSLTGDTAWTNSYSLLNFKRTGGVIVLLINLSIDGEEVAVKAITCLSLKVQRPLAEVSLNKYEDWLTIRSYSLRMTISPGYASS